MPAIPLIDLHQDFILHIKNPELFKNKGQTGFAMLQRANVKVLMATAFPNPPEENYFNPVVNQLIEKDFLQYNEYAKTKPDWAIIKNAADLERILNSKNLRGFILHIEGLNVLPEDHFETLEKWYGLGWRSLGPVWNYDNPLGGGTLGKTGLTEQGKKIISWLEKRRMILDFAHMNEKTFFETAAIYNSPILVSHANAKSIFLNNRNLSDDQLKKIKASGGIVGVFCAKKFISEKNSVSVKDLIRHINKIRDVAGVQSIAIGTDFGGLISGVPKDLNSISQIAVLAKALKQEGYTDSEIEKIFFGNALRVLKQTL